MSTVLPSAAGEAGAPAIPLSELLPFKDSPLTLVVTTEGLGKPHFRCAACGEVADPTRPANLVWKEPVQPYVVHKAYCCSNQAAHLVRSLFPYWCELDVAAVFLLRNTGDYTAPRKANKLSKTKRAA